MKLVLLNVTLLIAALGYGSRPVTTEEFLALDPSIRNRLLIGSVRAATESGRRLDETVVNERLVRLRHCVERAAATGAASSAAAVVIDDCGRQSL